MSSAGDRSSDNANGVPHGFDLTEVTAPADTCERLTNRDLVAGPPIPPLQRVTLYSAEEFERFVEEWAYGSLRGRYARVQHAPGAGDKGRDVIGFVTEEVITSDYDIYQCKNYGRPLQPGDVLVEMGKVCVHTFAGHYRLPRRYFFVSPHGTGPKLQQLLQAPERLKVELIDRWKSTCEVEISQAQTHPLEGALRAYVEAFDFSIFDSIEPNALIDDLRGTAYFTRRFGGLQRRRPDPSSPPQEVSPTEARYVQELFNAYADYTKSPVESASALEGNVQLRAHFGRQREAFYRAEALREFERDTLADDANFLELKDEIFRAVIDVCEAEHETGYHRVNAVTGEARRVQPTDYAFAAELHLEDRVGICHHLANEDRLRWVK